MQVLVRLQADAVNVNIWDLLQLEEVIVPASHVTVSGPHSLDAVTTPPKPGAVPTLAHVGNNAGLQPSGIV